MNFVLILTLLAVRFCLIVNETYTTPPRWETYEHMTAQFGVQSGDSTYKRTAPLVLMEPDNGCEDIQNKPELKNAIVLVKRGVCNYINKALNVANAGGIGMVVGDNKDGDALVWMSKSWNAKDVYIPCVFISKNSYDAALTTLAYYPNGSVMATISLDGDQPSPNLWNFPSLMQLITYLLIVFPAVWAILTIKHLCQRNRSQERRERRIRNKDIPEVLFTKDLLDPDTDDIDAQTQGDKARLTNSSCPICLENFEEQTKIKRLPCQHGFHSECIGPWIIDHSDSCPICRQTVIDKLENNEPQRRCCCFNFRVQGDAEIMQPLIESESEENGLAEGTFEELDANRDVENPVRPDIMSLQPVEAPVPVDSSPEEKPVVDYKEREPNSIEEQYPPIEQAMDLVDQNTEEIKHEEKDS